ncbi:MAG: DUF4163 domain-containing protein [Pseudomonadota bacterium]
MKMGLVTGVLASSALTIFASCSSPEEVSDAVGVEAETTPAASAELESRVAVDAEPVEFKDEATSDEATRDFNYSWPRQASAIPELAKLLEQRRDAALAEQKSEWQEALEEFAGSDCVACRNRGYGAEWQVVADLPRFLSLSSSRYTYTGGAHGNSDFDALIWDREESAALNPLALFTSPDAVAKAIRKPWCDGLRAEKEKRLGEAGDSSIFGGCPTLDQLNLLIGSSNGETFDRIGLQAAPYVAGSYAEGAYEVTVPVTQDVIDAVQPQYKEFFSVKGQD